MSRFSRLFRPQSWMHGRGPLWGEAAFGAFIDTATGSMPYAERSSYDQLTGQPWERQPLPLMSLVQVEGVDFPFFSRWAVDNAQRAQRRRAAVRRFVAQPEPVSGPNLPLMTPPDDTLLQFTPLYETPAAYAYKRKAARSRLAGLPATFQWAGLAGAFLPATFSDTPCRIYSEIQRHMLEAVIDEGLTWSVWTAAEVEGYLYQRVSRFLTETGLVRERRDVPASTPDIDLPADTIEVMRTVWNDGGNRSVLVRLDKWALDQGRVGWHDETGIPTFFVEEGEATLSVEVTPAPSTAGVLELVIIAAPLIGARRCAPINLPRIFTPYIKWGVVADMLSKEGEAQEPKRAAYAESRFAEGIELAKLFFAGKAGA